MVATLLIGLHVGGVAFVVLAPSVARLPGPAYVRCWRALIVDHGRAVPPLLPAGIAALIVVTALSWRRGWFAFGAGAVALILVILTVVLTPAGLVILTVVLTPAGLGPLNRRADAWDPDLLPADWQEIRGRWQNLHLVRTGLALAAFVCLLTVQTFDRV
ncbi:anthrone oxygenase family protein [Nonomuraea sp. NPDC001699]